MNDLYLSSIAKSLNVIAEGVRDLNKSIDYLTDKIGELKHE